jgi:hypothetical protein
MVLPVAVTPMSYDDHVPLNMANDSLFGQA